MAKEQLKQWLTDREINLAGVCASSDIIEQLPESQALLGKSKTVIVIGKRILMGVSWARHLVTKQIAGARNIRFLERAALELACELEDQGHPTLPLHPLALDFESRPGSDLLPAGQGSMLVRTAAVHAGLGSWGLNNMVLSKAFGPRIYLNAVATTLALEPDSPLAEALCPGLENCGRCALVCPQDAIPRRAPLGAAIDDYRGLDCDRCSRSAQPYGFDNFLAQFSHVIDSHDAEDLWNRLRTRQSSELWMEMTQMKEASTTGCSDCLQVCPVGDDYERIARSPQRMKDIPESFPEDIPRVTDAGYVEVENRGPALRRLAIIDRDKL